MKTDHVVCRACGLVLAVKDLQPTLCNKRLCLVRAAAPYVGPDRVVSHLPPVEGVRLEREITGS